MTDYKSGMPAYEDLLTDEEIWEILSFIRSTGQNIFKKPTRHAILLSDMFNLPFNPPFILALCLCC